MTQQQTIREIRRRLDWGGVVTHADLAILESMEPSHEGNVLMRDLSEKLACKPFAPYQPEFEPKPVSDETAAITAFNSAPGFTITE